MPLYGETSSVVTAQSAGFLTHILSAPGFSGSFSFPIRWLEQEQGGLSEESSLVCDPPFFFLKKKKKIHKPPSRPFPAISTLGFDVIK